MIVIADSSPLIALIKIGHADVLPLLFGRVLVPPEVMEELRSSKRPQMIREFVAPAPYWLVEQATRRNEMFARLDSGETAAINLALELGANALLIDEYRGRRVASSRNIQVTGTLGVLELAAADGMIDLAEAFDRLSRTDFWVSRSMLETRLKLFRSRKGSA